MDSAPRWQFIQGDCARLPFAEDQFDLVFGSPPYEGQREYGELAFDKTGREWMDWALPRFLECLRVCKGLVAWVIEGATTEYDYSATPFLLMADLKRKGIKLRKPCVYQRQGIPGTGGPDWLRNDWEPIICATKRGKLPWSNNVALGTRPVPGGRRYQTRRGKNGQRAGLTASEGSARFDKGFYKDPDLTNPGNVICGNVGGHQLGWADAHENEAPFPEWLAEFFVRSFCPPDGWVLDPFSGSGTTIAAAVKTGRNGVGVDIRSSQTWLGETRLLGLTVAERKSGQGLLLPVECGER